MWIRSQDKRTLIKFEDIEISGTEIVTIARYGVAKLGIYSTEEKALKVLDMIEKIIDEQEEFKAQGEERKGNNSYRRMIKFVFQMPQDDEV